MFSIPLSTFIHMEMSPFMVKELRRARAMNCKIGHVADENYEILNCPIFVI